MVKNEARRAELAIANLISNKREWNNCFIKFSTFGSAKFYSSLRNDRRDYGKRFVVWRRAKEAINGGSCGFRG